jgi:GNAT superfamily N-acetyltransferase
MPDRSASGPAPEWAIRPARPGDAGFLAGMLTEAVNWDPSRGRSRESVLADPRTGCYVDGWPRPDDLGVVAEADGIPAGAAWLRVFTAASPAYGFVAPDVPELVIGLVPAWRGKGIGRALLRALADAARAAGFARISLSAGRANFAHGLYLAEGYQVTDSSDPESDVMVRVL